MQYLAMFFVIVFAICYRLMQLHYFKLRVAKAIVEHLNDLTLFRKHVASLPWPGRRQRVVQPLYRSDATGLRVRDRRQCTCPGDACQHWRVIEGGLDHNA